MQRLPSFRLARLSAAAGALLMAVSAISSAGPTGKDDASLLRQGQYVARAADCISCHTAPGGVPYAGGDPLKSPLGTLYGPNITQDAETGIGSWTQADFEKALRLGVRKDGAYLYPAMPYEAYTKMSESDMNALWAFMRTIAPVNHTVPKNTLPFPLTVRSGMAVWQGLYFKPGLFVADTSKDYAWNRGAYLVLALGHCNECHTPRNVAQATQASHAMTGAKIDGWFAPDISSDIQSKLNSWKVDELAHYLKTGTSPDNVKVAGPMAEVVYGSLKYLSAGDLKAIATYLKDQSTDVSEKAPSQSTVSAENLAAGKALYENNCSSCHQSDGRGAKGTIPSLAKNDLVTAAEPYNVIMAMLEGFPAQGSWGAMASFANTLDDEQIADITNYVRTAWGNDAPTNAVPWSVGSWRKNIESEQGQHELLCPNLARSVISPALTSGATLKQAASDPVRMSKLVADYQKARPKTTRAETVEALSAAYCRAISTDKISETRMSAQIARFSQRVASSL